MKTTPTPDLVGQSFGTWIVVSLVAPANTQTDRIWSVVCKKCNRIDRKSERWLNRYANSRANYNRDTGCSECYKTREQIPAGTQFGLWTVTGDPMKPDRSRELRYPVRCMCGKTSTVTGSSLRFGNSLGCRSCRNKKDK